MKLFWLFMTIFVFNGGYTISGRNSSVPRTYCETIFGGTKGVCVDETECDFLNQYVKRMNSLNKNHIRNEMLTSCNRSYHPGKVCCPLCGDRKPFYSKKIINGTSVELGKYPWMVALVYLTFDNQEEYSCGGSLISDKWVITAAHCIVSNLEFVRLGDVELNDTINDGAVPQIIKIQRPYIHPEYKSDSKANDIALLRLEHSVNFTANVYPICLSSTNLEKTCKNCAHVTGWGYTTNDRSAYNAQTTRLQAVKLDLVENEICKEQYKNISHAKIDDTVICAAGEGQDACLNDSGGPLSLNSNKSFHYLTGIVSYGVDCAVKNFSGVYTNVAYYYQWIQDTTHSSINLLKKL